jgi:hypothetical protein
MITKPIRTEQYQRTTFKSWTDGPKYLFDLQNVALPQEELADVKQVYANVRVEDVKKLLEQHPTTVGTFYVLGSLKEFMQVVDVRPDLDVRLLTV